MLSFFARVSERTSGMTAADAAAGSASAAAPIPLRKLRRLADFFRDRFASKPELLPMCLPRAVTRKANGRKHNRLDGEVETRSPRSPPGRSTTSVEGADAARLAAGNQPVGCGQLF